MLFYQDMDMKKRLRLFAAVFIFAVVVVACVSPITTGETQPSSSNDVATVVAMTLQALASQAADAPTGVPESSTILFPHSLYFLSNDSQALLQVFRMERDGKTKHKSHLSRSKFGIMTSHQRMEVLLMKRTINLYWSMQMARTAAC